MLDMIEFLRKHPISHPTRIERATLVGRTLELLISGNAWWKEQESQTCEGAIIFRFEGISEGSLAFIPPSKWFFKEDLESFSVDLVQEISWMRPLTNEIFCYEPLTSPIAIYVALEDYLIRIGANRRPEEFLNGAKPMSKFIQICASASYKIADAPQDIADIICMALERQGVAHSVLIHGLKPDHRIIVSLEGHDLLCDKASVLIERD